MTKYVLHGGFSSWPNESNKKFFQEIVKGLSGKIKILMINFARPKDRWVEIYNRDKKLFRKANPKKKLEFTLASDDPKILTQQIIDHQIIFVTGGNSGGVRPVLRRFDNLKKMYDGKVVAGVSAGVNYLGKYSYSNSRKKIKRGLGLLPYKIFCHFNQKKIKELDKLKKYRENLKTIVLFETEYIVIKK